MKERRRPANKARNLPSRVLVQYWNDSTSIPIDVIQCLDSWLPLEANGFVRRLFDDVSALRFIERALSRRHVRAFLLCDHPAMRADYFRLCYILQNGGFYVDADDEYLGHGLDELLSDGRLKLQALCYDISTQSMVDPYEAGRDGEDQGRIFYVNNNPLIAPAGHPIIARALERATGMVLSREEGTRDIQSLTGPGNLTVSLVEHVLDLCDRDEEADFHLLTTWDAIAVSKWPLMYRSDERNWRNWVHSNG
ncbi:glycosyltransferase family 32 protein [Allorhizocola rhizosphaerae]|uniref:glycosyltransferase family 32 protein n=1 Tax=Allorhizocola rhizosphaerae TaxID=1872709 RepID=UPI00319E7421